MDYDENTNAMFMAGRVRTPDGYPHKAGLIIDEPRAAAFRMVDHYEFFGASKDSIRECSLELAFDAALGLNVLAMLAWQVSHDKGWHLEEDFALTFAQFTSNVHGEVSELWEAWRDGKLDKPCDKAEGMRALGLSDDFILTSEEEELADIVIRVLDYAVKRKVDLAKAVMVKTLYNATRPARHGGNAA